MKKTKRAIVLNKKDNVATMLNDVNEGETVEIIFQGNRLLEIEAMDNIPFGHKISLKDINEAEKIVKYGEVIGVSVKKIRRGEHVHIHNIKSAF